MAASGQQAATTSTAASTSIKSATTAVSPQSESVQSKRDLVSWWKNFKRGNAKTEEQNKEAGPQGIFGVPLAQSIRYANVAISLYDENGQSYIYGYVPIVVAKCGVFLKEKATDTEGIFRLAGSEKRIKELKVAFDSPEKYGKGLDWTGYTVHDAANILRRYFNQLPEPIIPLDFYERFRVPLRDHQQALSESAGGAIAGQTVFRPEIAIKSYQSLITELPPLNRQLLLYILDLLAVFASKADLNKMTTPNLSAIFQPGILSHPQHDMSPDEYRLSQDVLIFLIENQDSFLIGMHGTAADEKTMQDVQKGYQAPVQSISPSTTPTRSRTVVERTSSNASGISQGRNFSGLRRNLSSSSRTSRKSSAHAGQSPLGSNTALSGGVYRSNTVPSQRGPGSSPRFTREKSSGSPTPRSGLQSPVEQEDAEIIMEQKPEPPEVALQAEGPASPAVVSASSSGATTPLAGQQITAPLVSAEPTTHKEAQASWLSPETARREASSERTGSRGFLDRFRQAPTSESERRESSSSRQPRKLQKKRIPGSALSSAASSANDLAHIPDDAADSVASPTTPQYRESDPLSEYNTARNSVVGQKDTTAQRALAEAIRSASPHHSLQSTSITDASEGEFLDDGAAAEKQEKKRRWRFSHSAKSRHAESMHDSAKSTPPMPSLSAGTASALGSPDPGRTGSGQGHASEAGVTGDTEINSPHDSDEKRKGPVSWIKGKIQERKEKEAEKRSKSPAAGSERRDSRKSSQLSREENAAASAGRGGSLESTEAPVAVPVAATTDAPSAPTEPVPEVNTEAAGHRETAVDAYNTSGATESATQAAGDAPKSATTAPERTADESSVAKTDSTSVTAQEQAPGLQRSLAAEDTGAPPKTSDGQDEPAPISH